MSTETPRRAVAIGGGTGLPAVLRCLLDIGFDTTAVVTVADDGGSSGELRRQLGILPPGDIRNCLVAMARDPEGLTARLMQYRFPRGEGLGGHAMGNLILAAMTDITGGFPEAIDKVGQYLHVRGRVLPSTLTDVLLHGVDRSGNQVSGQAMLAANPRPVDRVFLEPTRPAAYAPAVEAIEAADVIVIGPGSLFTSIIPNFLVDGVAEALRSSRATRVYVCNVANMRGETYGFDAADHVRALQAHGLGGAIDIALVHRSAKPGHEAAAVNAVASDDLVVAQIETMGPRVVLADLASEVEPNHHAIPGLRRVLEEVLV